MTGSEDIGAAFDLITSDRALMVCFNAHLVRNSVPTFRDALYFVLSKASESCRIVLCSAPRPPPTRYQFCAFR
ncbi:hypothetical protein F3W84_06000 [Ochrobactrum quorumnocens]|uniref:Uncharacterized protein n=1 Tax=Ochrobactrum quorumnocens TaxID=271865 RepID=A0A5N1K0Q6_9HYPH|nr:hypothetical protein F3W84_06000 [[Ochrobactrum] quorumnocens]